MTRDLATLDDTEVNGMSTDELEKLILENEDTESEESEVEESESETEVDNPPEEKEEEIKEESTEDEEEEEEIEDSQPKQDNGIEYLKKQNEVLLSELLNKNKNTKPVEKKLSKEEEINRFIELGPQAYIDQALNKERKNTEGIKLELAFNAADRNPDFKRLNPVVKQLMTKHPNLVAETDPYKKIEGYYLLVKGLEATNNQKKALAKTEKEKAKRIKSKKSASSLPKSSKKAVSSGSKTPEKMTLQELEKHINSMTG